MIADLRNLIISAKSQESARRSILKEIVVARFRRFYDIKMLVLLLNFDINKHYGNFLTIGPFEVKSGRTNTEILRVAEWFSFSQSFHDEYIRAQ